MKGKMIGKDNALKNIMRRTKEKLEFYRFAQLEKVLMSSSEAHYEMISRYCELAFNQSSVSTLLSNTPSSPLVQLGQSLREKILGEYRSKFFQRSKFKFLIHVPPPEISPAGYSVFSNLVSSMNFMGIPARALLWSDNLETVLKEFAPDILISSDHELYLCRIELDSIFRYRSEKPLFIGLTASLEEYGNTPLAKRLDWGKTHGVDFYYSFRSQEYIGMRKEYARFSENGNPVVSLEFGANPLIHYPVAPGGGSQVDYVFLASSNYDKWPRYFSHLSPLAKKYTGFVAGPGWSFSPDFCLKPERDTYIYSCGRIGINLSIEDQITWPSELNERTYILAACGIPQLIDNPRLLPDRFSTDSMFSAQSSGEYLSCFKDMLNSPKECERRAGIALQEVYASHTTFHRVEAFLEQLASFLPGISAGRP